MTRAAVVADPDLEPVDRLRAALDRCDALVAVSAAATAHDGILRIVIVPEVGAFEAGSPTATEPRLVEALIDLLHDAGHTDVVVGATADSSSLWAGNRDVHALADLLGYGYVTPDGRDYDIIDLAQDLVPGPFEPGEVLAGSHLSRAWLDAGYRIVFAKNCTDDADGYSLALRTALRALPLTDEDYHYRLARPVDSVVAELVRHTPIHLTLIDAVVSSDGSGGTRAPRPHATRCLIASHDIWLADAIGATKMGLDPGVSRLFAGAPPTFDGAEEGIDGSLAVYDGWTSPHPLVLRSTRLRDASPTWMRLVGPWLQVIDTELFPLESPLDARVNARLASAFADIDEDPAAFAALVVANLTLGNVHEAIEQYRTLFAKDALRRAQVPLGFDLTDHHLAAYEALVTELGGLEQLLSGAPERAPGLRWRKLDGSVLFDYRCRIAVPFDRFVSAVDVARTISSMNDYLGGVVVPVEYDEEGRVVRQAERNLYLPQPNYLVVWGGQPIDVGKLEVIRYEPGVHRMYWKTVASANGSATHDDGIVTFRSDGDGTVVTIFGRQRFTLPPALAALDLELVPDLEQRLITDAYRTFFDRTAANLEALTEGRDILIGRPWTQPDPLAGSEPLPSATLERLVADALDWVDRARTAVGDGGRRRDRRPQRVETDEDGFMHFRRTETPAPAPEPATPAGAMVLQFWSGLVEAGLRDLARGTRVGT